MNDHAAAPRPWHARGIDEALAAVDAGRDGLSADAAQRRLEERGPNELPRAERPSLFATVLRQFTDPLIYILLAAAIVSLGIGNVSNAVFIFAVLFINAAIGTVQERQAESSAEGLESLVRITVQTKRGGEWVEVDSTELAPGDLVRLESGQQIPADLRLIESDELRVDESLLTGESEPVTKDAAAEVADDAPLGDRLTLAHAGSTVVGGRGLGTVIRTGAEMEIGRIAASLQGESQDPPLVVKMKRFTNRVGLLVLIAIGLLALLMFFRGDRPLADIFFLGVALAVSAIPAGLPVAVSVALARAAKRMAERHVIVRKLPAVEGLGSCTIIASDKTGTLTENAMTAQAIRLGGGETLEVGGTHGLSGTDGREPDDAVRERAVRVIETGALCNEAQLGDEPKGDPVDQALLRLAETLGIDREALRREREEVGFLPFESERRFAASFNREAEAVIAHVKGASGTVTGMTTEDDLEAGEEELADRGYRVLAFARGEVEPRERYDAEVLSGLDPLGQVGFVDPVRGGVSEAVERCFSAGVGVRIITGDHPKTGLAIARKIAIAEGDDQAVAGRDLPDPANDETGFDRAVEGARVFARIEPAQKTKIVESLQRQGHFVAVTGDGVNDAPALKAAHIGIAMGKGGTDVARSTADLILTDDNFASIVNGIEEGRVAYDNVRKVIWLLLSTGTAEVLLFFLAVLVGLPIPLTPVQLLWLNLVTNGIQDVALAFEPGEPGVLNRPPRDPSQRLFDPKMIQQVLISGLYIGGVAFAIYAYLSWVAGMATFDARNMTLMLMVLFENVHALSCRSERRSVFRIPLRTNVLLVLAIVAAQSLHQIAAFVPGLSDVLEIEPIAFTTWLMMVPLALTLLAVDEAAKAFERRRGA